MTDSAQALCTRFLRDEILAGRLCPGERIRPEAVAARLGLSRMPVREALRELQAEGLVILRPNRGAVVTPFDHAALAEIFEMRAVLEGLCARHAARLVADHDLVDLDMDVQAMHRVWADPLRWAVHNEAFHDRVCVLSGRLRAAAEARRLRQLTRAYVASLAARHAEPEAIGHEHELILDALRDRNAAHAEQMAIAHVLANAAKVLAPSPGAPRHPAVARQG
jgi:DNA-binding GntR family transcriptional regulator